VRAVSAVKQPLSCKACSEEPAQPHGVISTSSSVSLAPALPGQPRVTAPFGSS